MSFLINRLTDYARLIRLHRPVGIYLLLWPTLLALFMAGEGQPKPELLLLFTLGVVLLRSAGCAINDYADRHFDAQVARTKDRPLAAGRIAPKEALVIFALLTLAAAQLLWFLPISVFYLALIALALLATYPFMKRLHFLPQAHLGLAFAWATPMAFVAQSGQLPLLAWVLLAATMFWTLAYDTFYALADKEDDAKIGVKSSALLFGRWVWLWLGVFYLLTVALWAYAGMLAERGLWYALGLALFVLILPRLFCLSRQRRFIAAFTLNHWAGLIFLLGVVADYHLPSVFSLVGRG
jgi:4-hydroxybenzoate polyprenyltransferase